MTTAVPRRAAGTVSPVNAPGSTVQNSVAVLLRTRNRPLLLARALDDLAAQTYTDFVVVVVNDAGDQAIVKDALAQHSQLQDRVVVVHNIESQGREAALNVGLHAAGSTFVAVHDDDDTWHPEFLERTVGHLEATGAHGVAVRAEVVYERIEDGRIVETGRELLATDRHQITLVDLIGRNYMPTNSLVYRRDVHERLGEYDASMPVLADWDFYLRFLRVYEIDFLDGEPLAFWHQRPDSTGDEGNSVQAGIADHLLWDARIRDRYLRADLAANDGLGHLLHLNEVLNRQRAVEQDRGAHLASLLQDIRHIAVDDVLRRVNDVDSQVAQAVSHLQTSIEQHTLTQTDQLAMQSDQLIGQLRELNRNLVSQNNRIVAQFQQLDRRVDLLEQTVVESSVSEQVRSARRNLATRVRRLFTGSG